MIHTILMTLAALIQTGTFFVIRGQESPAAPVDLPVLPITAEQRPEGSAMREAPLREREILYRDGNGVIALSPTDETTIGTWRNPLAKPADLSFPIPANAWWGSGLLEDWPAPQYPWPLRVEFSPEGIRVNQPGAVVTEKTVFHDDTDPIIIRVTGDTPVRARAVSWGDFDVTFAVHSAGGELARVTLMEGSPTAYITLNERGAIADLPDGMRAIPVDCGGRCAGAVLVSSAQRRFLLAVDTGRLEIRDDGVSSTDARVFSVTTLAPGSAVARYFPYVTRAPRDTRVRFAADPFEIRTEYSAPFSTLMGILPHQRPFLSRQPEEILGVYDTLHGPVSLVIAREFATAIPHPPLLPGLPPPPEKSELLLSDLRDAVADPRLDISDVYGAAKNIWRLMNIMDMGIALRTPVLESQARQYLRGALVDWCTVSAGETAQHFAYDDSLGGMIGLQPSYGSEHYNDHHFHWGYFLRAAASLAASGDPFLDRYGNCVELLVRDIAAGRGDPYFPSVRTFDPYAGHSWANGLTKFADGQNQESTSEAMQAWHAIALLGRVTGDADRRDLGAWLYAQEAMATRSYWMDSLPGLRTLPETFTKPMISILWQGKIDYLTFFDPDPTAIHGIQFFPLSTVLLPVIDSAVLSRLVRPLATPNSLWGATLEMVRALGGDSVWLPPSDTPLEPAYTRAYLRYWTDSLASLGEYDPSFTAAHGCAAAFRHGDTLAFAAYRYRGESSSCAIRSPDGTINTLTDLTEGWNVRTVSQ